MPNHVRLYASNLASRAVRSSWHKAALACYAASLCLPGLTPYPGAAVLLMGWWSVFLLPVRPDMFMGWAANFTLVFALTRGLQQPRRPQWLGLVSLMLVVPCCITFWLEQGISAHSAALPGSTVREPFRIGIGMWLWFAAMAIAGMDAWRASLRQRRDAAS